MDHFSEGDSDWHSIPPWVHYLVRFGYLWKQCESEKRRIVVISMPCPSPGAGLIALGAMIGELGKERATNALAHESLIFGYAREYLEKCRKCTLDDCNPAIQGCGLRAKNQGIIRSSLRGNRTYKISEDSDLSNSSLVLSGGSSSSTPWEVNKEYIMNLYRDGGFPAISSNKESDLPESAYRGLVEGARILPENLRRSYSGLVLAGRSAGERETRRVYDSTYFCDDDNSYTVAELLSIRGWSESGISRTAFYNPRNESLDHEAMIPELVVADGDTSFLKCLDSFKTSDVIGVIDRTSDRDRLEAIGLKLTTLRDWYQPDTEIGGFLPSPVPGISVVVFRKQ